MATKLKDIFLKFSGAKDLDTDLIDVLEKQIRQSTSNRSAAVISEMIDNKVNWSDIEGPNNFNDLITLISEYQKGTELIGIDYEFTPPLEDAEFNDMDLARSPVPTLILKDGQRIELASDGVTELGPVDDDNTPLPGHKFYEERKPNPEVTKVSTKDDIKPTSKSTTKPKVASMIDDDNLQVVAAFIDKKSKNKQFKSYMSLEEYLRQTDTIDILAKDIKKNYEDQIEELEERLSKERSNHRQLITVNDKLEKKLEQTIKASVVDTSGSERVQLDIGSGFLIYRPNKVVLTKYMLVMYFTEDRQIPFIPKIGSTKYPTEYNNNSFTVQYLGGMFQDALHNDITVLTFLRIDAEE